MNTLTLISNSFSIYRVVCLSLALFLAVSLSVGLSEKPSKIYSFLTCIQNYFSIKCVNSFTVTVRNANDDDSHQQQQHKWAACRFFNLLFDFYIYLLKDKIQADEPWRVGIGFSLSFSLSISIDTFSNFKMWRNFCMF